MSFKLNNSAECLGYLCLFIAMNDGKLHKKEAKRTIESMAKMLAELELDSNNDGDVNIDDLITHEFPLEDINKAFDLMHEGKSIRTVINF